ncbi:MAG TPA: agmatinase [Gemmatimonadales bacterium]|nr:agmatinase [Gemmatimonadales bacterium]
MSGAPTLIGLPYDASSSFLRGAAGAPPVIRAALHSPAANGWAHGLRDALGPGGLTDAGDLALPPGPEARALIEDGVAQVIAGGGRPIALGGDHSVTYPAVRAVARSVAPLTILHIDAHSDLYDVFEGDRYSHACPFARIMEERLAVRLVQIGIRTLNRHQREQADRFGVEIIDMAGWLAGSRPRTSGKVYLSIDLDGLDPAYAPGVSHQEPGGLATREVLSLVQELRGALVGADVVEYNPDRDVGGMTATVAAKMVKEIAGRMMAEAG